MLQYLLGSVFFFKAFFFFNLEAYKVSAYKWFSEPKDPFELGGS